MNLRLTLLLLLAAGTALAADVPPVISAAKRTEGLDQAKAMLSPRDHGLPDGLKDPFFSATFVGGGGPSGAVAALGGGAVAGNAGNPNAPRSAHDLLAAIAAGLKPRGVLVFRGEPVLNFGQKRVKAGDPLTITFEGTEYTVVISSITPPNFTIRLEGEEFTRPIK